MTFVMQLYNNKNDRMNDGYRNNFFSQVGCFEHEGGVELQGLILGHITMPIDYNNQRDAGDL